MNDKVIGHLNPRAYKKKYVCAFCENGYISDNFLKNHIRNTHADEVAKKMNVTTVEMDPESADAKYKEYLEATKTRKEEYLHDLKKVYKALKDGKKVIDIYEAFKDTGVDDDGNPKLAISRADQKECYFHKEDEGAGLFNESRWGSDERKIDVRLPGDTFEEWKTERRSANWETIKQRDIVTNVPLVPAHLLPPGHLKNYYLLWEVDEWKDATKSSTAAVGDPFLLRRVNANTFIIFAAWDLTDVEKIVMRGL